MTDESTKLYSKFVYLDCLSDKSSIYLEDTVNIDCTLDNQGDQSFDNVSICIDGNCSVRDMVVQKIPLHYTKNFFSEGLKNVEIKVYNDEFTKVSYVPINVLDKPQINITELSAPENVKYGDSFDIGFTLSKNSKSSPKNLKLALKSETNKVEWTFPEFDGDKTFTIKSSGDSMKPNKNNYQILVSYDDEKGNVYTTEKTFIINSQATFFEDILLYINLIGQYVEQVFTG
jgi:hypothetical protein